MRRELLWVLVGAGLYYLFAAKLKGAIAGPPWAPMPAHAVQGV